jgi:hypothetical protein
MCVADKLIHVSYSIVDGDASRTWTFENVGYLDGDFIRQTGGDISARNLHNVKMLLALVDEYKQDVVFRERRTLQDLIAIGERRLLESLSEIERQQYTNTGRIPIETMIRLIEHNRERLEEIRSFRDDFEMVNVDVLDYV